MALSETASSKRRDDDRLRIAQLLHDGPCQTFSGARLLAEVLRRDAEAGVVGDAKLYKELTAAITIGVNELHQILVELRNGGFQLEKGDRPS